MSPELNAVPLCSVCGRCAVHPYVQSVVGVLCTLMLSVRCALQLPDEPAEWYAVGFERIGWNVAANRPFPRQGVEGVDTMEVVQWLDKAYNQAIDADEEEESLGAEEKLL